jgi:hypothetical protein
MDGPPARNCTLGPGNGVVQALGGVLRYDTAGWGVLLPSDSGTGSIEHYCAPLGDKALAFVAVFMGLGCCSFLFVVHGVLLLLDITTMDCLRILGQHGPARVFSRKRFVAPSD